MLTLKVNRNNISGVLQELPITNVRLDGDTMEVFTTGYKNGIEPGDSIVFKSYIRKTDNQYESDYKVVRVLNVENEETFITNSFGSERYYVVGVDTVGEWKKVTFDRSPYVQGVNIKEYNEFNGQKYVPVIFYSEDGYSVSCDDVVSPYGDVPESLFESGIEVDGNIGDNVLFIKGDIEEGMYAQFSFDSVMYYDIDGNGYLWETTSTYVDRSFYNVPIGLSSDDESRNLFQDVLVNDVYVSEIVESLYSEPIDMEKIKYVPYAVIENNITEKVTGLTFNFHFRERVLSAGTTAEENEQYEKTLKYEEGWHCDETLMGWCGGITNPLEASSGELLSSDLVAYLDFTDNDIENQKKKVSKSFLRLTYYDDRDPVDQSLLFYSTTFMDAGTLFGRYVKKKRLAYEEGEQWEESYDPKHIVRKEGDTEEDRVSSQIVITDEYDLTKSSEGFNLYLFASDAPEGNNTKTIYMKVEFNHAGYGRTIPFVKWPEDSEHIYVSSYIMDVLYIPVDIEHYVDENVDVYRYLVRVDGRYIMFEDGNLIFNLFEPKISIDEQENG